ncbi:MAG: hypothetical protein JO314_12740 [Acidobacteria bacterium]|nr:hypothetical protein [Acidobacteriota bacterium]
MWEVEDHFSVKIGGNYCIDTPNIVAFRDDPIFVLKRSEDGYLGIWFEIFDDSGQKVASVKRNEIYAAESGRFSFNGTQDSCELIENSTGRVLCGIKKRSEAHPMELDVTVETYLPDGRLFNATPDSTTLGSIFMKGNVFQGCGTALAIN